MEKYYPLHNTSVYDIIFNQAEAGIQTCQITWCFCKLILKIKKYKALNRKSERENHFWGESCITGRVSYLFRPESVS